MSHHKVCIYLLSSILIASKVPEMENNQLIMYELPFTIPSLHKRGMRHLSHHSIQTTHITSAHGPIDTEWEGKIIIIFGSRFSFEIPVFRLSSQKTTSPIVRRDDKWMRISPTTDLVSENYCYWIDLTV